MLRCVQCGISISDLELLSIGTVSYTHLKTIITALEGYLSSKKKSGNDGWIPVEERLPDAGNGKYYPLLNVATSYGVVKCGFYRVRDKQWYIYKEI